MSKRCSASMCYNSQLTHKVAYFGFPKNEPIAKEWARLAGRDDLLEKKLENLTKYYLCSDHFLDSDFVNPDAKEKVLLVLNRNSNHIPLPSRFENNLQQNLEAVIQNSEKFTKVARYETRPMTPSKKQRRGVKRKQPEIDEASHFEEVNCKEETFVEEIEFIEEIDDVCRLCAKNSTELVNIFNEHGEYNDETQCISIMVNFNHGIQVNDGLPQVVCFVCLGKIQSCSDIMGDFVRNQSLFLS